MNKKVSIIVPIYNCEKYLSKCINSLLKQTYENLEIILVDDGSTDNSLKICKEYAKNPKIKLIHQENMGVSVARNVGLKNSMGEYVAFVDADDYVNNNYIENAVSVLDSNTDFVLLNMFVEKSNKILRKYYKIKKYDNLIEAMLCLNIPSGPGAKLYSKKIINKYNLEFDKNIKVGEDLDFNCRYFKYVNNYKLSLDSIYYYAIRSDSVMMSDFKKFHLDSIKILNRIKNEYKINKKIINGRKCLEYIALYQKKSHKKDVFKSKIIENYPYIRFNFNFNLRQRTKAFLYTYIF